MINVDIDLGRHTMQIPSGMRKLFLETIKSLGVENGDFKVHLGRNIKGGTQKGIRFIKLLPESNAVVLKAQPNTRDGRHICALYLPDKYKNQLSEFAEILQKKVGKEDLDQDELIAAVEDLHKENPPANEQQLEVYQIENILLKQQQYEVKKAILTTEMLTLIVSEIFGKHGTGWIIKKEIFSLLNKLKLEYPANKLIGQLLRLGYLEKDPVDLDNRSRLSHSACLLIGVTSIELTSKEGESEKIFRALNMAKEANDACASILKDEIKARNDLEKLEARKVHLKERLEALKSVFGEKIKENEKKIVLKKEEIESIVTVKNLKIIESSQRLEDMCNEFSAQS